MSENSTSSRFRLLFDAALQDYEEQTGMKLVLHPLATKLEACDSVESIAAVFQEQSRAFHESRGDDGKVMKSLQGVVHALHKLSSSTTLRESIGHSFPPAKAILTGFAILLVAVKNVSTSFDALIDLLDDMGKFLNRLDVYTNIPPTEAMTETVVGILVELISTLSLATKEMEQGRPKKFVRELLGKNKVEAALQRLDKLAQNESRTIAAQTLGAIYGLDQKMKDVIDDGKASADGVRDALKIMQQNTSDTNKAKRRLF
ncbi:hypothetical protein BJV74DRAFT_858080 [Russula compacta]|nr:hypothetical protein BJV74DRAFT_858080 [Russula compacta]